MLCMLTIVENEDEKIKLEELYEAYRQEMHRQAYAILKDEDDAEDAVQDAFFGIWRNLDKLQYMKQGGIKWYVICAARYAAIDIYRDKKKRLQKEETYDENFPYEYSKEENTEDDSLYGKISNFPDRERDVLMLKYVYGFQYKEISKMLHISVEAVKKALTRARSRLKKLCREEGLYND